MDPKKKKNLRLSVLFWAHTAPTEMLHPGLHFALQEGCKPAN